MDLNFFDKIIYINLDHRKDRKKDILKELEKAKVNHNKIHRISACFDIFNGHIGCCKSHIKALNFAIKNKLENVLILEDDCIFTKSYEEISKYLSFFINSYKNNWDVFFLGATAISHKKTPFKSIKKILSAETSHSYSVNNHYFSILKNCFEKALKNMENFIWTPSHYLKALDQVWKNLQKKDNWYIGENFITKQSSSFSDIKSKITEGTNNLKKKKKWI